MDYSYKNLDLYLVPLRSDNYSYVIHDRVKRKTLVIDPSEAKPLLKFLEDHNFGLDMIIDTHHHEDHTQGNRDLQDRFGSRIVCSAYDHGRQRIPGRIDRTLEDGDQLDFSDYS